eukprot:COSAG02_NODE_13042_length_1455_cov_1.442478_1_plen_20_part_10
MQDSIFDAHPLMRRAISGVY